MEQFASMDVDLHIELNSQTTKGAHCDWFGHYISDYRDHCRHLGFGGIAGVAVEAAKPVLFVAIVLFVISVISA